MNVEVVGKNGLEVTNAMKEYATNSVSKVSEFFKNDSNISVRVVCKVYNDIHKVEITFTLKNLILRAEVKENDMYVGIDRCVEKIVTQIKKHNSQVKNKLSKVGLGDSISESIDVKGMQTEILAKSLVRNKNIELKPMSVEQAIAEMDLVGHDFYVFMNSKTNSVSVVYLRDDHDYAVIDTSI